jgi:hypothetical protein
MTQGGPPMNRLRASFWKVVPAVVIVVFAFGAGLGVGWSVKPKARAAQNPCVASIVEDLEDAEKLSEAAVTILNEMVLGRASNDATSMSFLRDSMQEMASGLGNLRSQIEALRQDGRLAHCTASR